MFERIASSPGILGGKPCIRGTRVSVEFILELIASGASHEAILQAYPHLAPEDVTDAIRYATHFLENEIYITAEVAA